MKLQAFRIENYKKIEDTGWITCENLMIFVGKNESGKSAIFRALSKMNASDGESFDGLREFPRHRYALEFSQQDWPVVSGLFALSLKEQEEIASVCEVCQDTREVTITRHYSGLYSIRFTPDVHVEQVTIQRLRGYLEDAISALRDMTAPEGKGEELGRIKQVLIRFFDQEIEQLPEEGRCDKRQLAEIVNQVASHANEEWQKELLNPLYEPVYSLLEQVIKNESFVHGKKYVIEHLPRFIYFDKYNVLDSAVHIPTFIATLQANPNHPGLRATNCLFRHVNLNLGMIEELGSHKHSHEDNPLIRRQVDERAILLSTASNLMTSKFRDWWDQRRHRFRYDIDGDFFRIWVSDDIDSSEIELDQRSAGMQYFFSFFVVFLVEAGDLFSNSIILLDEPGISLHASAQYKAVRFLERIAEKNQLFFSTHSPFMVDFEHMERVRAVYESDDGRTRISEDEWPLDHDSLFPIQAGVAFQLAQGLFVAKKQLILEDISDLWLILGLNYAMDFAGRKTICPDLKIIPSGGLSTIMPLASLLKGNHVDAAVLLSGSDPGLPLLKKQIEHLFDSGQNRCLFIGDYLHNPNATLEDIFNEELYLSCVRDTYPQVHLHFVPEEEEMGGIVARLLALFLRNQAGSFEKWRVAERVCNRIFEDPAIVGYQTLETCEHLFSDVNRICE